jgi:PST family polysaccharide transporter
MILLIQKVKKISSSFNFKLVSKNLTWLFLDKLIRLLLGLYVTSELAKYFNPDTFGLYNYLLAIVSLFGIVGSLGINSLLVVDVVRRPLDHEVLLGSSFRLLKIGSVLAFGLCVLFCYISNINDDLLFRLSLIVSFTLFLKPFDPIRAWFEAKINSRKIIIFEAASFVIFSFLKILMIVEQFKIEYFIWLFLLESISVSLILYLVNENHGVKFSSWRSNPDVLKSLIKRAWPLLLSNIAIMLYMRIDQIMLMEFSDAKNVGLYSAVVRISELFYVVPMVVSTSLWPYLMKLQEVSVSEYEKRLKMIFTLFNIFSIGISFFISLFSDEIIMYLYGYSYLEAVPILNLHIWATPFVCLGVFSSQWYIVNGCQNINLIWTIIGAVLNILLNIILMPKFGAYGAAVATLFSYSIPVLFLDIFNRKTFKLFTYKFNSIVRPFS